MIKLSTVIVPIMVVVSSCFADAYQDGQKALENKISSEAAALFEKACDSGNAKGCFELGLLYEKGDGVVQNKYKAVSLYTQACRGGEAYGCSNISLMYDTP
ncbi:MAG: tetratricopeptide repeat protein [Campylobacterales bacterium]|nr:tetratricopeptide repeat protein [Campylobacterales bacterium]